MTAVESPAKHHHHQLFSNSSLLHHSHPPPLVQPPRNHYVNVCPDRLPPPPPPSCLQHRNTTSPRDTSESDSEISTSSISGLSDSSEIRTLFATLPPTLNQQHSPGRDHHYNQLKVREGSKVAEKTRRILHRPSHFESDSSSSLAESSESLTGGEREGTRQREKEHYDKLKLNLNNLAGNKKAISGEFVCSIKFTG